MAKQTVGKLKVNIIGLAREVVDDPRKMRAIKPYLMRDDVKWEIGKKIIDEIVARTLGGKDKNNSGFASYSKAYKASDEFAIYGKSSSVNLKLTGSMLAAIDVTKITPFGVQIGFVSSMEERKAAGHVWGQNPNRMPIRDFWGLPDKKTMRKIIDDAVKTASDSEIDVSFTLSDVRNATKVKVANQPELSPLEELFFAEL